MISTNLSPFDNVQNPFMFLLRSVFSGFADLICKNLSIKKHSIEQRNSTFPITLLHTAMGATASRSDKILQNDIETFEASMLLTKRPIMWGDEGSVAAHSALNSLRNAQYHILSGRRGRGLRVAAASKFNCTGRVTSLCASARHSSCQIRCVWWARALASVRQ